MTEQAPGRSGVTNLEREGEIAADFLEKLLDIADLDRRKQELAAAEARIAEGRPDLILVNLDLPEVGGLATSEVAAVRGGPLVLLYSDDLDASVERVRAAGGEIVNGPYAFPGGRRFHFTDPSGNELGVWSTS